MIDNKMYKYSYPFKSKITKNTYKGFSDLGKLSKKTGLEYGKSLCKWFDNSITTPEATCTGTECSIEIYKHRRELSNRCGLTNQNNEGVFHTHPYYLSLKKRYEEHKHPFTYPTFKDYYKERNSNDFYSKSRASYADLWNALHHKYFEEDNGTTCILTDTALDILTCFTPDENKENLFRDTLRRIQNDNDNTTNTTAPGWLLDLFYKEDIDLKEYIKPEKKLKSKYTPIISPPIITPIVTPIIKSKYTVKQELNELWTKMEKLPKNGDAYKKLWIKYGELLTTTSWKPRYDS